MPINHRPTFDASVYIMLVFLVVFQPWVILYYEVNGSFYVADPLLNLAWAIPLVTAFVTIVYVTGWKVPGYFAGNGT